VHTAGSEAEALTLLQFDAVDAIILDVVLGQQDGLSLIPVFRTVSVAPIIILTGNSSEDVAITAARARVHGYLKKPVQPRDLLRTLAGVLAPAPALHAWPAEARSLGTAARGLRGPGAAEGRDPGLRRFRAAHGMTPRQYQRAARLARAAGLLRESSLDVGDIAMQVGFPTLHAFGRLFQRAYGATPHAFRAAASRRPTSVS
jgi:YesN/AraC family two-component response regulator